VILDEPLNAPDGTEVFVEVNLPETEEPFDPRRNEIARQAVLSWITDPELRAKLERESDLCETQ